MGKMIEDISRDLMMPIDDLRYLASTAPYRYKVYEIPKRNPNERRVIAQPARELKRVQGWIVKNVLSRYPIHPCAVAYQRGKSIFHNAAPHARGNYLLKMDFEEFFHSIKGADMRRMLADRSPGVFETDDIGSLERLLFWRPMRGGNLVLSIGAPSSPYLSNLMMLEFDERVSDYCKTLGVAYTRYADDLTFSAHEKRLLGRVEAEVHRICRELPYPRLRLNRDKRVHASRATSRRVTGLTLSNDGLVSIGRERKRELRAAVHHFVHGKLNEEQQKSLAGKLAFVHSVERKALQSLADRYGPETIAQILRKNRPPG